MSIKRFAHAILLLSAALVIGRLAHAQSPAATISLEDRARMATQIYHIINTFFPSLSQEKVDADYAEYLHTILHSDDRREFDLASMEFVALCLPKMLSGANASEISDLREAENESPASQALRM